MKKQKVMAKLKQLLRYFFIGGIASVVDYSASNIAYLYMSYKLASGNEWVIQNVSSILGIVAGMIINYFMAVKFVFDAERNLKDFLRLCIVTGISCVLTFTLTTVNVKYFDLPFAFFKIVTMGIVFVWNYLARSLWVYRKPESYHKAA